MEYTAFSELFDPVSSGHETPEYEFVITKKKDGSLDVRATKVDYDGKGTKLLRKLRKLDG